MKINFNLADDQGRQVELNALFSRTVISFLNFNEQMSISRKSVAWGQQQ